MFKAASNRKPFAAVPKLNRTQKLLTAEQSRKIPALYAQDGKGREAIAYVKFFTPWGGWSWFATEYNPEDRLFFGVAYNASNADQCPDGELGYFSADEFLTVRGPFGLQIERDIHFKPQTLAAAMKSTTGREYLADRTPKTAEAAADDAAEAAAVAEFDADGNTADSTEDAEKTAAKLHFESAADYIAWRAEMAAWLNGGRQPRREQ